MKLGHAAALLFFLFAVLTGGIVWWDLQDGLFSSRLLLLPVLGTVMGFTFLLFPGGPATVREARNPAIDFLPIWRAQLPAAHRRAWVVAVFLTYYLSMGLSTWLQGENFLTLEKQLTTLFVIGVVFLLMRRWMRRPA